VDIERAIEKLRAGYPLAAKSLALIENIRNEISVRPLQEFFEPVSAIDMSAEQRTLESIGQESMAAWTKHIAYSTQLRMGALEPAILSELVEGRVVAPMVMLRSHMEIAGLAALCEKTLMECVRSQELEPLKILIPKTILGTSMVRRAKKDELTQDMLLLSEQGSITITSAIEAMDKFPGQGSEQMRFRRFYALLCDFAHPNFRGAKHFMKVLDENESGWVIKYEEGEKLRDAHVDMALQILSDSMRVGYAASELLRLADFSGSAYGFSYASGSEAEIERIWTRIIQRPIDNNKSKR